VQHSLRLPHLRSVSYVTLTLPTRLAANRSLNIGTTTQALLHGLKPLNSTIRPLAQTSQALSNCCPHSRIMPAICPPFAIGLI